MASEVNRRTADGGRRPLVHRPSIRLTTPCNTTRAASAPARPRSSSSSLAIRVKPERCQEPQRHSVFAAPDTFPALTPFRRLTPFGRWVVSVSNGDRTVLSTGATEAEARQRVCRQAEDLGLVGGEG
jgi:hypothetical protein